MPIPIHDNMYMCTVVFASDGTPQAKHWSNTVFFKDDGATPMTFSAAADAVKVLMDKFFGQIFAPGTARLSSFLSQNISIADSRYKVYDLGEPAPRIPQIRTYAGGAVNAGIGLPNECAAVISYRSGPGTTGGGSTDKRKRGRIFLGPLAQSAVADGTASHPDEIIYSGFMNAMLGAADYLRDQTDNDLTWVQYSRAGDTVGNVSGGFVENAFDTQRRRGLPSSVRTTW